MIVLEWNINKRSAKNILAEPFVSQRVLSQNADVICLVEYTTDIVIKEALRPLYWVFESVLSSGNQILLAVKKSFVKEKPIVIRDYDEPNCYNFLHIKMIGLDGNPFHVIGLRMLTGSGENSIDAQKQTPPLNRYLKLLKEKFICVGDYNIMDFRMAHWFSDFHIQEMRRGKREIESASYFFPKRENERRIGGFGKLDHILTDQRLKVTARYNWDFVHDHPIYPSIDDINDGCYWSIDKGFPDHAMLIAEVENIKDDKR